MKLSITTDYLEDRGDPSPYLRRIAEAGFSGVHWCHQWNTDFVYCRWEIEQIGRWLGELGLAMVDLHGPVGPEKDWGSRREYERLAGVELVANRMEMVAQLGSDVVIMHLPAEPEWDGMRRSLDALEPVSRRLGVRVAVENIEFAPVERVLEWYEPSFVGLCYDSGHGNLRPGGLDWLESRKDRLISVHLHDNRGGRDEHNPLFSGTVDWARLAGIVARSSYGKCVSMEVTMKDSGIADETAFLRTVHETGGRLSQMIEAERQALPGR